MQPLNGRIILKEVSEKKIFKGIIIPKQLAATQIIFAKIIALPKEELNTKGLTVGDYVVLGYSPIWEKKFKHRIYDEDYLIVDEYSILSVIKDPELLDLVNVEEDK